MDQQLDRQIKWSTTCVGAHLWWSRHGIPGQRVTTKVVLMIEFRRCPVHGVMSLPTDGPLVQIGSVGGMVS
jgi:hypothetical protein